MKIREALARADAIVERSIDQVAAEEIKAAAKEEAAREKAAKDDSPGE